MLLRRLSNSAVEMAQSIQQRLSPVRTVVSAWRISSSTIAATALAGMVGAGRLERRSREMGVQ
jgi:hypothetical protein